MPAGKPQKEKMTTVQRLVTAPRVWPRHRPGERKKNDLASRRCYIPSRRRCDHNGSSNSRRGPAIANRATSDDTLIEFIQLGVCLLRDSLNETVIDLTLSTEIERLGNGVTRESARKKTRGRCAV